AFVAIATLLAFLGWVGASRRELARAPRAWATLAAASLALAGAEAAAMADGFVVMLFALQVVSVAALATVFARGVKAGAVGLGVERLAAAALIATAALYCWTFGGSWNAAGEFAPDVRAQVSSVDPASAIPAKPPAAHGAEIARGFLTMTSYTGALVYMD